VNDVAAALEGLKRIDSVAVDVRSHHYITLSFLHPWVLRTCLSVARGVLLDFGCGGQPYRRVLEPAVSRYIGADVAAAAGVEPDLRFVPGQRLALPDASVDTILSTQVLEHVEDVDQYLNECFRLLKPQGHLVISVPMQWRHHEVPFDHWRFTRFGLERTLREHGFELVSIEAGGGAWALMGQILLSHLNETGRLSRLRWCVPWINRLSLWLDRRYPDPDETLGWMALATRRPSASSPDAAPTPAPTPVRCLEPIV
jgi:SAM-dependent methyltransferase